jgi:hypothetical protein
MVVLFNERLFDFEHSASDLIQRQELPIDEFHQIPGQIRNKLSTQPISRAMRMETVREQPRTFALLSAGQLLPK